MEDFSTPTGVKWNGNVGTVEYGNDKSQVCLFFNKAVHNPQKSTEQGRPYFEEVTFVRIHPPGERLNIVERPARTDDQRRFPMQWQQFKENREQVPEGTPVDLLYPNHPAIGAMLRANNVHTVEQLAALSGPAIDSVGMGAQRYVNDATKYLQVATKGVKASQMRAELEERDRRIDTLETNLQNALNEIGRLTTMVGDGNALQKAEQLVAGMQRRPQYPASKQLAKGFDAATAQINANSPTRQISNAQPKQRARRRIRQ